MIRQSTFADIEAAARNKETRKERFLREMEAIVPWQDLIQLIEPFYPKGTRRPTCGLERMLRLYFIQQWFGYADEATEDAVIDIALFRRFLAIDLLRESVPDATTLLNFRRLLETNGLAQPILESINQKMADKGLRYTKGTIIDATIIQAPSSTKNEDGLRDPEMHSTKKGGQCYFGMKAHIGVDAATGLAHSVEVTAANTADIAVAKDCLHGEEEYVFGDAGYTGIEKRLEHQGREVEWQIAKRRSQVRYGWQKIEQKKASIRAKVEHIFGIIKCRFGYRKVRYRGLLKNGNQVRILIALANLVKAKKYLLCPQESYA